MSTDPELIAGAKKLFAKPATLVCSAPREEFFPEPNLPEVAFAGRSNVGKSSLINALCQRTSLARTSNTPGRTQMLTFFSLAEIFLLVDLPGYGYAAVSQSKIKAWGKVVERYLKGRVPLKRVFVLVDSRHGFKPHDHWVMDLLDDAAQSYQIILTKCDKISGTRQTDLKKEMAQVLQKHPAAYPEILATSAVDKEGLDEVRSAIYGLMN